MRTNDDDDGDIIHVGGRLEDLVEIAAQTDGKAILEAAEALRAEQREERTLGPGHAADLFAAVARRRGPFILRLEAELMEYYRRCAGQMSVEGQNEFLAPMRRELGALFRADVEAVIADARGE
jgi:hypothetical protein